jgi:hypothetical protein
MIANSTLTSTFIQALFVAFVKFPTAGAALGVGDLGHKPGPCALGALHGFESGKMWNNSIS